MKKLFLSLAMALISVGASAQTTWNVRGMFGVATDGLGDPVGGGGGFFQANVPFKRGGQWTFSPTAYGMYGFNDASSFVFAPYLGYKTRISDNLFFSPKIGPAVGAEEHGAVVGLSSDIAFEIKHFVVGVNGHYSFFSVSYDDYSWSYDYYYPYGVFLSLGYKF